MVINAVYNFGMAWKINFRMLPLATQAQYCLLKELLYFL